MCSFQTFDWHRMLYISNKRIQRRISLFYLSKGSVQTITLIHIMQKLILYQVNRGIRAAEHVMRTLPYRAHVVPHLPPAHPHRERALSEGQTFHLSWSPLPCRFSITVSLAEGVWWWVDVWMCVRVCVFPLIYIV